MIADPDEEGIPEGERRWRNYLSSLHYADASMGCLMETLEREGLMGNTVFVMVTDHGEAFYQHAGNYNHPLEKMAVFHTSWTDELMGVRDGKWKYIPRIKDSREELYDLEADPGETANMAGANPTVTCRYREVSDDMISYMLEQYRSVARKR